ncbi:MAG: DoxX family membrane protein [Calditrichaeota bacterium]|nr:MAG: DoxX family membrane protein [Calditrichota bacterium]
MHENSNQFTKSQLTILVLLRVVIGYHFLFLGLEKFFNPDWTSAGFLLQSNGLFADFYHSVVENANKLAMVDLCNIWGQILIGVGLIAGLFARTASFAGALILLLYYSAIPPFLSGNLFIDGNLIELLALLILALFPTSQLIGLDYFIHKARKS